MIIFFITFFFRNKYSNDNRTAVYSATKRNTQQFKYTYRNFNSNLKAKSANSAAVVHDKADRWRAFII